MEKFVKYLVEQVTDVSDKRTKIINFLNKENDQVRKTFKLFILKELKSKYIMERTRFLNIEEWKQLYQLKDLFFDLKFNKPNTKGLNGCLEIPFYSGENLQDFLREKEERILNKCEYKNIEDKKFIYNIDLFINENLSTLTTEEGYHLCKNSAFMQNFNNYVNENNAYSGGTKKLINLFFDQKLYNSLMFKAVQKNKNYFEIILYAYRFSILCSLADRDSIYYKMINGRWIKNIFNSYIPGADLYCDLEVESYMNMSNIITRSHEGGSSAGYYICDCGEYYYQAPCGVPKDISFCANCSKKIGGLNQKLVMRDGEYKITRIYPNERNRRAVEARPDLKVIYGKKFEKGYPWILFEKFEEEIMKKRKREYKGILEQSYLFFITKKSIRELDQISFRLLNFIIYSNIYFAYKCGFISLKDINKNKLVPIEENAFQGKYNLDSSEYNGYRRELLETRKAGLKEENADKGIIRILCINWIFLQDALKEKGVDNIKIFINLIYKDLIDIIINSSDMLTIEKRKNFEAQINYIISEKIKEYKKLAVIYRKEVEQIYQNNLEQEFIIIERNDKIDSVEKNFPYYYDLLSIPLINFKDIKKILDSIENSEKKYTVLYNYLAANHKAINYLESFSQINHFVNYTISHYSNLISRKEASKRIISEEIENKEIPKKLFDDFLKAYNNYKLYEIAQQYGCHVLKDKVEQRALKETDNLSCFLIDNGVVGHGMQLVALYEEYIKYQNSFLDNIVSNIDENNKKLKYLKETISAKINPQKANQYNIVSFNISKEIYSFLEILLFYSYIDSSDSNNNYDFSKSDKIKYNLEEIEEELEGLLLPGKKMLNNNIEFVVYQFEGFRNDNSSLLIDFIAQYPQEKLNDQQKQILFEFKNEQYSTDVLTKILFSIQLMINFYKENTFENDQNIYETFSEFPDYFKIHKEVKALFEKNKFKLMHIVSVYEYFELLCFNEFKKNLDPCNNTNEDINKERKEKMEKYFACHDDPFINKLTIATAVRRFISRNLVGIRENNNDINGENELFNCLFYKEDCWDREIISNSNLFEQKIEELKQFGIKIKESLKLYEFLGGDDILLGEDVKNHIIEQEEKENEEVDKNAKKKKGKKRRKLKDTF